MPWLTKLVAFLNKIGTASKLLTKIKALFKK
jgi:hypothetical protein